MILFLHEVKLTIPGGALALAVWQETEQNPFLHLVTEVLSRYVETPPADPDAPGAFRFAEPGKLATILTEAGAIDVRERFLSFHIEAPISIDEFWELRSTTSATLREKLADLSKEQTVQVAREVREAALEFFPNGKMSFPARMIIVTAWKP